jgi:benzoylformate decarboxylase
VKLKRKPAGGRAQDNVGVAAEPAKRTTARVSILPGPPTEVSEFQPAQGTRAPAKVGAPSKVEAAATLALPRTGNDFLVEQLELAGLDFIVGNPGSSEETLYQALGDRVKLAMAEGAAVGLVDGYAQASGKPGVVVMHGGIGLGSGLANLMHAAQRETPMLVIVGESGIKDDAMRQHMHADIPAIAKPWAKMVNVVSDPKALNAALREAIVQAMTPPHGPVVLVTPRDVLDAPTTERPQPIRPLDTRSMAPPDTIEAAAQALKGAKNPILLIGDDVARAHGQDEVVKLAEALGARVFDVMGGELNMPKTHPLYAGQLGHMFGADSKKKLEGADAVVVIGTPVTSDVYPLLDSHFAPGIPIVAINQEVEEIAKGGHQVTHGMVASPKLATGQLAAAVEAMTSPSQKKTIGSRTQALGAEKATALEAAKAVDAQEMAAGGVTMAAFAQELAKQIAELKAKGGKTPIIWNEALTNSPALGRYIEAEEPGTWFETPGGTLGVAFPGAIGAKTAHPDRAVIGFSGDGGSQYTIQTLGTAARHKVAAGFVVVDNNRYGLLDANLQAHYQRNGIPAENQRRPHVFDLSEPNFDFVAMAKGWGVDGLRVEKPQDIAGAVKALLAAERPLLVHLVLTPSSSSIATASERK